MQKWEYLFISAKQNENNLVHYINGNEVANWKKGMTIYDYANKLGEEGWEMVSAPYTSDQYDWTSLRLIFKRQK